MFELTPFNRHQAVYDPFRAFDEMNRTMFGSVDAFRTDIKDTGDAFKIEAELPGFKKEDVKVTVEDDTLTITATHEDHAEEKNDKNGYIRRERRYGTFTRSFDLTGIDAEKITGSLDSGILTLELPKKAAKEAAKRTIELA